jgi:hypothetical protein
MLTNPLEPSILPFLASETEEECVVAGRPVRVPIGGPPLVGGLSKE